MVRYFVWCLTFCFDSVVKPLKLLKTKAMKNICVQYSTFHPGSLSVNRLLNDPINFPITLFDTRKLHTCQPPDYKSLKTSRNLCIVRMSLKTMSRNNLQKVTKKAFWETRRFKEKLGDSQETERVGRCALVRLAEIIFTWSQFWTTTVIDHC